MRKNIQRAASALLAAAVALLLVSCARGHSAKATVPAEAQTEPAASSVQEVGSAAVLSTGIAAELKAERLGLLDKNVSIESVASTGVVYKDASTGKYGIMSADGSSDTGAIYAYAEANGKYFEVISAVPTDNSDVAAQNCVGLVDVYGNEVIPNQYAGIEVLGDNYAEVAEANGVTASEDDALLYKEHILRIVISIDSAESDTSDTFRPKKLYKHSLGTIATPLFTKIDTLYTGNWYLYDLTTGKIVSGITGATTYKVNENGRYITYFTDIEEKHVVNGGGTALPDNADLFDDGCYTTNDGSSEGLLYNTNDELLFSYDRNRYEIGGSTNSSHGSKAQGDYFIVQNLENSKYFVVDEKGNPVSAEFDSRIEVVGSLIFSNNQLYDFSGHKVTYKTGTSIKYSSRLREVAIITGTNTKTVIDMAGNVLYHDMDKNTLFDNVNAENHISGYFYCYKDGKYTIGKAWAVSAPWLVKNRETNDLIDTFSGETLLSGYKSYYVVAPDDTSCVYIFAQNSTVGYDIYKVSAK